MYVFKYVCIYITSKFLLSRKPWDTIKMKLYKLCFSHLGNRWLYCT